MKIVWGNSFENKNNYLAYEKKARDNETGNVSNPLRVNDDRNALRAEKMEARLRATEDKMLEEYRQQIVEIQASSDDDKIKNAKIADVTEKIKQIELNRAERERAALERELEKRKTEEEKRGAKTRKNAEAGRDESQDEVAVSLEGEDIKNMVELSVSHESLKEYARTKAMLKSEAKQLEIDLSNDFGISKYGRVPTGYAASNDFKHRQLDKLNMGIAGLETEMAFRVRKMAREITGNIERKIEGLQSGNSGIIESGVVNGNQNDRAVDDNVVYNSSSEYSRQGENGNIGDNVDISL